MKPLYLKITEENQVGFIKVVKNGLLAAANVLIQSSDNSWTSQLKTFDLNTEKDKQEYADFIASCLESNPNEFDEATKEVLKQLDALSKKNKGNS